MYLTHNSVKVSKHVVQRMPVKWERRVECVASLNYTEDIKYHGLRVISTSFQSRTGRNGSEPLDAPPKLRLSTLDSLLVRSSILYKIKHITRRSISKIICQLSHGRWKCYHSTLKVIFTSADNWNKVNKVLAKKANGRLATGGRCMVYSIISLD